MPGLYYAALILQSGAKIYLKSINKLLLLYLVKIVITAGLTFAGLALKVHESYAVKVIRMVLRWRKLPESPGYNQN